ncbi:MAG: Zn-ribbon domain-containing OB-fold protein [Armatimonadetes bacterium]|nr:Zn-ribbon domain-containing OB-fold protein [Armatimonadota bacterium]
MGILEKVADNRETKAWYGDIPVQHLYTAGVAGERFLSEIRDNGKILGTLCEKCNFVYVPPMIYCERCFARLTEWVPVSHKGVVESFTVGYIDMDGKPLPEPRVMAVINLDGATSSLVHFLEEIEPDDITFGMEVEAVFRPKGERKGSILDISHFRPVG